MNQNNIKSTVTRELDKNADRTADEIKVMPGFEVRMINLRGKRRSEALAILKGEYHSPSMNIVCSVRLEKLLKLKPGDVDTLIDAGYLEGVYFSTGWGSNWVFLPEIIGFIRGEIPFCESGLLCTQGNRQSTSFVQPR